MADYSATVGEFSAVSKADYEDGGEYTVTLESGFVKIEIDGKEIGNFELCELERNPVKNW